MAGFEDWKAVLPNTDVDTANLIVQLQMEDALALSTQHRSQNRAADDANFATVLLQHECKALSVDLPNRKLGEQLEDLDNDLQEIFEAAAFGWKLKDRERRVEYVPDPAPQPAPQQPLQLITCTSCTDDFQPADTLRAPCGDHYCSGCMEYLFTQCMTDETLFPPRCCQTEIPYQLARHHLSQRCRTKFGVKRIELETKDRTYCWVPTCSAFIKPDRVDATNNAASCPRGHHYTCALCKQAWHYGPCPRDANLEMMTSMAEHNGWQRCSVCRRILELKYGCNHMFCPCKHEFCYVCGVTWKNCACPQWDEDRLIERAEQVVVEGRVAPNVNVAGAVEHLRQNHECTHERFDRVGLRRPHDCEICGWHCVRWICRCRNCLMQVCNQCRKNRL